MTQTEKINLNENFFSSRLTDVTNKIKKLLKIINVDVCQCNLYPFTLRYNLLQPSTANKNL